MTVVQFISILDRRHRRRHRGCCCHGQVNRRDIIIREQNNGKIFRLGTDLRFQTFPCRVYGFTQLKSNNAQYKAYALEGMPYILWRPCIFVRNSQQQSLEVKQSCVLLAPPQVVVTLPVP